MADYNLGRAHGEISITADTRGAREAQAAMASTAAEAAALDASMGRVNKSFDENRTKVTASAESIVKARGEIDQLRRAYQQQQEAYAQGQERINEATRRGRDVLRDQSNDLEAVRKARVELDRAESEGERLRVAAAQSYERYRDKMQAVRVEVERFNAAHVGATAGFRNMRNEAEKMGAALENVTEKLSGVARVLGQAGLFGLFGGAAGGSLFATGAGGLQLLAGAASVAGEVIQDFIGVMALAPAAINGAVLGLGTLAVAFHGVGAALSSIEDPTKFLAAIRDMGPITQQAMLSVQSFTESFRGARQVIQESLFAPIIQDIQPLIRTWLPELMNAGRALANQFGQAFHQVFQVFQTPEARQGFQTFTSNLVNGFQAARGAIQPFLQAWNTLATVGSGVFERIGKAITIVANEFNNWIQRSAQSGQLLNFLNRTLDSITQIGHIARDAAIGINNIFNILRGGGGTTISTLAQISAEFRSWTESVKGQQSIANFFDLIRTAANAVRPQIHLLGEAIAVIGGTLTRLGIAIQPGLNSFFVSFVDALRQLSPYVIQLAPAINQFLAAFGTTLVQIITTLGPRLPAFFQDMSDAFVQIMQVLPPMVDIFAKLLDHLNSGAVETILSLVVAFKALSAATTVLNVVLDANPFVLIAGAIAAVILGAILLATHWDAVKQKTDELTSKFGGLHGILNTLKGAWDAVTGAVSRFWNTLIGQISGGWDALISGLSDIGDQIGAFFAGLWNQAIGWGSNLINSFASGITSAAQSVLQPAIDAVASLIPDSWKTQSPAKRGPLSQMSPEEMGTRLVTQYAGGMAAGIPSVDAAASGVAGSASGIGSGGGGTGVGGTSFTSSGIAGKSGQDFSQGHSGFDQWISFITQDLSAWSNIFKEGWDLFTSVTKIVTDTIRLTADLWNGGDNPLTRPGGIAGPRAAAQQQSIWGVPNIPIRGQAPDPVFRNQNRGTLGPSQDVPGVPRKAIPGTGPLAQPTTLQPPAQPAGLPPVEGTTGTGPFAVSGTPPANPPASTTGRATGPDTSARGPGGYSADELAQSIITQGQAAGMNPEQIQAALGVALQETGLGTNPRTNVVQNQNGTPGITGPFQQDTGYAKYGNRQDPNVAARGFIDQFVNTGQGLSNPNPWDQALQVQRPARVGAGGYDDRGTAASGSYLRGRQGGAAADIYNRLAGGAPPPATTTGAATGAQGGVIPGAGVNPATQANFPLSGTTTDAFKASGDTNPPLYPPGSNTGGYGGPGQNVLPDWVKKFADRFGLVASTYPEGGTLHQAGYAFDFVPKPGNQDPVGSMDAFASFIQQNLTPQTLELIHFNERTGQKWGIAGAKDVAGTGYYESPDAFSEHGDYGPGSHVHWATDVPPILPGINAPDIPTPAQTSAAAAGLPTTPRGPGGTSPGGFHLPSDAATAAIGAAAVVGGSALIVGRLARMGSNARTAWLRSNFNRLDALAKLDVVRSLSPDEIAAAGLTDPAQITFGGPRSSIGGFNVNASGQVPAPGSLFDENPATRPLLPGETRAPSDFSRLSPEYQRVLGNELQRGVQSPFDSPTGIIDRGALSASGAFQSARATTPTSGSGLDAAAGVNSWGRSPTGILTPNPPVSTTGQVPPSVESGSTGVRGVLGTAGRLLSLSGPGLSPDVAQVVGRDARGNPITTEDLKPRLESTLGFNPASLLGAPSTGQESNRTPGVIYGPNGQVISAGPRATPDLFAPGSLGGGPGTQAERRGSTPVHVTNTQELPGGAQSPAVRPTSADRPLRPGDPGFVGPVAPAVPRTVTGDQGPQPGAQAARQGAVRPIGTGLGRNQDQASAADVGAAPDQPVGLGGQASPAGKSAQSPLDAFTSVLGNVSSIVGDGFTIFQDVIKSIGAVANITDTLVRGFENTESVVGFIQQFQTFIQMGADVSKLVGDVGGIVSAAGSASGGADFGGTAAVGAAIQAIAGIVQGALEATNMAISLGIDIYHEVGKYVGFMFGGFLGGENTGPLGGNVRMLLNTRTNQLQTYSEDNPLNKNTFEVGPWQRSYHQQATPPSLPPQVNIYTGPGQTPAGMMQESMWMVSTGAAPVASVAGHD